MPSDPTLTLEAWVDSDTKLALHDFVEGELQTVLIQSGQGYGDPGVLAFWAYKCEYTGAPFGEESGIGTVQLPMRVVEDPTEATLPRWLLAYF